MSNQRTGAQLIVDERSEHFSKHKKDLKYDQRVNASGQLQQLALFAITGKDSDWPNAYDETYKAKLMQMSKVDRLVKCGSFIAAEIDRLLVEEGKLNDTSAAAKSTHTTHLNLLSMTTKELVKDLEANRDYSSVKQTAFVTMLNYDDNSYEEAHVQVKVTRDKADFLDMFQTEVTRRAKGGNS